MNTQDLEGKEVIASDKAAIQGSERHNDSNINVFSFANVLLAGILPTLVWLVNTITDLAGNVVSAEDTRGSSISEQDRVGGVVDAIDRAGTSISEEDVVQIAMLVTDFLSFANDVLDIQGTQMTVSEWSGSLVIGECVCVTNTSSYNFAGYTYDDTDVSYEGSSVEGGVLDISGT